MSYTLNPGTFLPVHESASCIIKLDGKVLLLQRKSGNWAIPTGKLEVGETPKQAVVREMKEETGINLQNVTLLTNYKIRLHKNNLDFVYHVFKTTVPSETSVVISDEHQNWTWATKEQIKKMQLEDAAELWIDKI